MRLFQMTRPFLSIVAAALCAVPAIAATTPAVADFNTCEKPVWPDAASRQGQHGTVTLAFMISEDGAVTDSKIVKSSGVPVLDMAARDGIMKCRFVPSMQDGKAQAAWMKMQYVWEPDPMAGDPAAQAAAMEADRKAAEGGDAAAALRLAQYYLLTEQGMADEAQGVRWLRKAADSGYPQAMEFMGSMLFEGYGMAKDRAEAARWVARAAERGSASAQMFYGVLLLRGDGVAQNKPEGEQWVERAAQQGFVRAQVQLADLRLSRGIVDQDTIAVLERAAGQGDSVAKFILGRCHELGFGVTQDETKAFALYARAAASGIGDAKEALAALYDKGAGLPEDRSAAKAILGRTDPASIDAAIPAAATQ